jgi:hypothetical protein
MSFGPFFAKNFLEEMKKDPKGYIDKYFHEPEKLTKLKITKLITQYTDYTSCWIYIFNERLPSTTWCTGDCMQGKFSSVETVNEACEKMAEYLGKVIDVEIVEGVDWLKIKQNKKYEARTHFTITSAKLREMSTKWNELRKESI